MAILSVTVCSSTRTSTSLTPPVQCSTRWTAAVSSAHLPVWYPKVRYTQAPSSPAQAPTSSASSRIQPRRARVGPQAPTTFTSTHLLNCRADLLLRLLPRFPPPTRPQTHCRLQSPI